MAERAALVTDGGNGQGRSALAAVRALAAAGWRATVTVSGRWSLAGASRRCAARVRVPPATDANAYAEAVQAELDGGSFDAVLPASDAAVRALGWPVARLLDKVALDAAASAVGLRPVPSESYSGWSALRADVASLGFPVVVKPRRSIFPARAYAGPDDLDDGPPADGELLVQPLLDEPMRAVSGVRYGGRLVAVVHQRYLRTWPVPCGTSSAAETVDGDRGVEDRLVALLEGHDGIFQAQFAGPYLLDLNPRAYGSLALAVAAGANLAALHCEVMSGALDHPRTVLRGRPGVRYRWLEGDVRHVLHGVGHRQLRPSQAVQALRPHRGTAHSVTTLADPRPGIARLAHVLLEGRDRAC